MKDNKTVIVGIDIGSVSADTVVMDENYSVLESHYTRTQGAPLEITKDILDDVISRYGKDSIKLVSVTGSGGKLIAPLIGATFTNEVISQARAVEQLYPEAKTVIEMGGQDAKLILMAHEDDGSTRIEDFQMNSVCAAGTGSFLDQQGTRMGLTIEEFGELSLKSKNPPRIAGRCSVFAKSDMIHLQQAATPDYDIVAGLCYAVARNFKSTIGKGKDFKAPVIFQGGVAANQGVRKAFQEVLELKDDEFIVPEMYAFTGAIGAAIYADERKKGVGKFKGTDELKKFIGSGRKQEKSLEALHRPEGHPSQRKSSTGYSLDKDNKVDVYMGLDIGSTSTNVVLIDKDQNIVSKRYLPTAGRPLEAVRQGLQEVGDECSDAVNVLGVGATGSGRYLIGDFVGGDVIRNEITAQAKAAAAIDNDVDTIFEIGGQDSKYIALSEGVVVDFEMNKVCAAGTGSFLEEQAERLGISIKGDFSELALDCATPPPMGDRCTVFIETDMVHHQQKGVDKGGLVAGLAYSIVHNYLNRVVGDRRIGNKIFFQGGTAANLAVVSAFEKVTGKKIHVPEHHDVTGAIGCAILAMEEMGADEETSFKGFDLSKRNYTLESFECRDCSNICEVRKVEMEGEDPLYYGGRCEKYDVKRTGEDNGIPNLFNEREKMLLTSFRGPKLPDDARVIGIPRTLMMYELYPFFKAFFNTLGFKVELSSATNTDIIKGGVEKIVTETCFPVKVAHGHVKELIDKGIKTIFTPSIVNMPPAKKHHRNTVLCPYVQSFPYLLNSAYDFDAEGVEMLQTVIHFNQSPDAIRKDFYDLCGPLGVMKDEVNSALGKAFTAQGVFKKALLERGQSALAKIPEDATVLVLTGRSYNTADPGLNLDLPTKLKEMNVMTMPFDMLPVEDYIDDIMAEDMYWKSGQRILATAKAIKDDPRLFSIYITNFGCGPDSYITHFYREASGGKPFLQLEIDEHSADAGAITRCEAFLDSLRNVRARGMGAWQRDVTEKDAPLNRTDIKKTLFIPNMSDGAYGLAAAFQACGIDAEVIPMCDDETLKLGRQYTSGRECYPSILTTGDMVKIVNQPDFDPDRSAFFMPSGNGPCRFGQYNRYHRMVLDELGFENVPVYAPDQDDEFYKELGVVEGNFAKLGWWGLVAIDLLEKVLREIRPYEKNPGETEKVYWEAVDWVCEEIKAKKFPDGALKRANKAFGKIDRYPAGTKPVVGLVGEIYVRSNRFSNDDIVRQLEALGAEVRIPPISEWIYYTNFVAKRKHKKRGKFGVYATTVLQEVFQRHYERRMENIFSDILRAGHEPRTKSVIKNAAPYIDDSFEGETVLSVGKVIDYISEGAHGIINVMPFTCMPGTIVNALLKKVREENDNIPYLNMVFEGIEDTNAKTRLEAFVHQSKEFMNRHKSGAHDNLKDDDVRDEVRSAV